MINFQNVGFHHFFVYILANIYEGLLWMTVCNANDWAHRKNYLNGEAWAPWSLVGIWESGRTHRIFSCNQPTTKSLKFPNSHLSYICFIQFCAKVSNNNVHIFQTFELQPTFGISDRVKFVVFPFPHAHTHWICHFSVLPGIVCETTLNPLANFPHRPSIFPQNAEISTRLLIKLSLH